MYSERHPIVFSAGLHNSPVYEMIKLLSPYGLSIDGMPVSTDNMNHLADNYKNPEQEVELAANHTDPQAERDAVLLARDIMQRGRSRWPNAPGAIPPERLNQAANAVRAKLGVPQEGQMQMPGQTTASNDPEPTEEKEDKWEHAEHDNDDNGGWYEEFEGPEEDEEDKPTKSSSSSAVKGEMSVESSWRVVSLGELQQPGGVGATQDDYNPVVDGPNPDGPNFGDNAGNSHEQEVALQTWVNMAIDMLNRGELEDAIIAQLAHDGCPDPQTVLQRALQQGEESPVSNDAGTDAFDMPMEQEPNSGGNDSVTLPQQDVFSKAMPGDGDRVLVRRTNQRGRVIASFLDTWGDGVLKIALDSGKMIDADPRAVVTLTEVDHVDDPLGAIQELIDHEPQNTLSSRAAVEARLANLKKADLALHDLRCSKHLSFTDRIKVDSLKVDIEWEIRALKNASTKLEEKDLEYLDSLPKFQANAFGIADGERPVDATFNTRIAEDAAILVSELPAEMLADAPGVELRAFHHASAQYASEEDTEAFLAEVERRRVERASSFRHASIEADEFIPNDGPAEDLFR